MTTITQAKPTKIRLAYFAVFIALISPVIQLALTPLLQATFVYPLDRFVSIWVFWAAVALVIYISVYVEKFPVSTFGITRNSKSLRYRLIELNAGLILGVVVTILVLGFNNIVRAILNIPPYQSTIDPDRILPFWVMFLAWITAAFAEEFLFRSYPIERLTLLTGNRWFAAAISLTTFVVFHVFAWGWIHVLTIALPGSFLATLLYMWRRSLWFVVIIHGVVNLPLLFLPFLAPYL